MLKWILEFLKLLAKRYTENNIAISAGYLTYSTMLAIVPSIIVLFSIFTFFPVFYEASEMLKAFIYDNFAPNASEMVSEYLELFVNNAKKMGLVSIIGLFVVALMLIKSIDEALNTIWHNNKSRPMWFSFLLYFLILIFGPLIAGASIAITTYITSLAVFNGSGALSLGQHLLELMPFLLIWLLFTLVYKFIPVTKVKFKHAAIGALLAAFFFTLGKQAFIWYITVFPSYQAIYGALAVLPIMLLWIQLSWQVVLLGGQFAAILKEMEENKDIYDRINSAG
ncbi:virulence factor BrkB family protein [Mannheimia indoligenes]|uniref:virulence factor BrkB family protein n=1 Tax=Mannheimia indoligenes TaxID=3103145 RepID=UPI002FE68B04